MFFILFLRLCQNNLKLGEIRFYTNGDRLISGRFLLLNSSGQMLEHINSIATVVGSGIMLGGSLFTVWRWSIKVNSMVEQVKETSCKVSVLETKILRMLTRLQLSAQQAEQKHDARFDRIEGKLNYLFGRTKTTIPPK